MGNAELEAKLAKAEAELAEVLRQIKVAKKNIADGANLGDTSVLEDLRDDQEELEKQVDRLTKEVNPATPSGDLFEGLAPSDLTVVSSTLVVPPESAPDGPDAAPLPSTEVFNPSAQPPTGETIPNVVAEPALYQAPELKLGSQPPVDGPAGVGFEAASTAETTPAGTGRRNAIMAGLATVTLVGAGVGLTLFTSKVPPTPTAPPTATVTAPPATATAPPVTETIAPTLPPVIAGPIRYASECNGACFMEVDPVTCDRTFHFVLALLGDAAGALEGKSAIIATVGPGLQPTYEVPVVGGKVTLDVVAKGSDYGANPNAGCAANASWTGLLTSVDGIPTTTPDAPT